MNEVHDPADVFFAFGAKRRNALGVVSASAAGSTICVCVILWHGHQPFH
jgi:hypothetical protein